MLVRRFGQLSLEIGDPWVIAGVNANNALDHFSRALVPIDLCVHHLPRVVRFRVGLDHGASDDGAVLVHHGLRWLHIEDPVLDEIRANNLRYVVEGVLRTSDGDVRLDVGIAHSNGTISIAVHGRLDLCL